MKRLFSLLMTVVLLMSISTAHAYQKQHNLHLEIEFDQNILMARYDVDVLINGKKVAQIPHGGRLDCTFTVPDGLCCITFEKVGHPDVCVMTIVSVIQHTRVTGEIHANLSDLEFRSLTTNCPETANRFSEGDVLDLNGIQMRLASHRTASAYNGHQPANGKVFLICQIEMTNARSNDVAVASILTATAFDACCDDYEIDANWYAMYAVSGNITAESIYSMLKGLTSTSEVIHPGKKFTFDLVYEVSVSWDTFELFYTDSTLADGEIVIVVNNN